MLSYSGKEGTHELVNRWLYVSETFADVVFNTPNALTAPITFALNGPPFFDAFNTANKASLPSDYRRPQ